VPTPIEAEKPAKKETQVEADIEIVGAIVPGAKTVVYFSKGLTDGFLDAVQAAVNDQDHRPSVILIGWGVTEGSYGMNLEIAQRFDEVLHAAANRNITVVAASGLRETRTRRRAAARTERPQWHNER
jgi:subtilase family serine protease